MTNSGPENEHYSYNRASSAPLIRAVLKNGETLKPIQRAGVFVISLMIIGWGIYFVADALDAIHNGSPRYLLFGVPSLLLIVLGLIGFANALRFRKGSDPKPKN